MAVGRSAQITAVARDAEGLVLDGVTFTWTTSPTSLLTVNTEGLVTAVAPGTGTVQATSGSQSGSLSIRTVATDLPGIQATLGDGLVGSLVEGLDAATATSIGAVLVACATDVTAGDILGVDQCLMDAGAIGGTGSGNDEARLAVLELFLMHATQQLQLGR